MLFLPSKILEGVVGIFTLSYTTYALTTNAYDDFATINTVVVFAYLLLMGWLSHSMTRYVGDNRENKTFFTTSAVLWGGINVVAYLAATVVYLFTGITMWYLACFMLTANSIYQMCMSMLVQTGRRLENVVLSLGSAVLKPVVIFVVCRIMAQGGAADHALPAVLGYMLAELSMGLIAIVILKLPKFIRPHCFSGEMVSKFFAYGFPLIGVSLSVGLLNFIDRFILIFFDADFSIYSANNSIASSVFNMLMVGVMHAVHAPSLEAYRKGGYEAAKPVVSAGVRLYLLVAAPAAAGLAGICRSLSGALFAPGYQEGAAVIGLTACAMFFTGLTEYAIKAWEMCGNTKPIMQNALLAFVLKIILSIGFLPVFGISGAALGSMLAFAFYFCLSAFRARKLMLFSVPKRRVFHILCAASLCGMTAQWITSMISSPVLSLICAIPAGGAVYVSILLFSGEIKDEISLVKRKLSKLHK